MIRLFLSIKNMFLFMLNIFDMNNESIRNSAYFAFRVNTYTQPLNLSPDFVTQTLLGVFKTR